MGEDLKMLCFCGATALYRVDGIGFCSLHRKRAVAYTTKRGVQISAHKSIDWDEDWDRKKARNIVRPKRDGASIKFHK